MGLYRHGLKHRPDVAGLKKLNGNAGILEPRV